MSSTRGAESGRESRVRLSTRQHRRSPRATYEAVYVAALAADEAFTAALVERYGAALAGDARCFPQHDHAAVTAARDAKHASDEAMHAALAAIREHAGSGGE